MIRTAMAVAALLATPILMPAAAQAEVVEQSDTHFVVRSTLDIAAQPKDVWLALIAPGDWWNDRHTWSGDAANMTLTPQAGGCFCETIPAEDKGADTFGLQGSVQHMVVVQAVPRKVLRMRGALGPLQSEPVDGVLTITLQPIEDPGKKGKVIGAQVVWEYVVGGTMRFEIDTISKAVDAVIGEQALGLAEAVGGVIEEADPEDEKSSKFDEAFGQAPDEETPVTGLGKGR
ncbi:SRPBCC family protein [Citromicrobium bathyomarinum]|uniref:SRPBCC family protein n=1 Tax=Citromicrobium bathyomarinum TaxID=72174 RepID=UPI00315B3E4C